MPGPSVFLSYSHEDEAWMERLRSHLAVLERQGRFETWDDRRIAGGGDWHEEIRSALERARVAVLLVSANSLTSDFILDVEVQRILERRAQEGVDILPVIVKACIWKQVPWLAAMQVRPWDGKPLASFKGDQRDSELVKIAEDVLELVEGKALTKPISPLPALPQPLHQLPRPVDDFTGREAELAELRAAVRERGVTISGVRGLGGVGKTQLALKLADELKSLYPDAQLLLDLQGAGPQPLTPAQAMAHVIHAFHPAAQLPDGAAELGALYRSVLHGQRVLLLMDNAANREQIEPLIPPAGCALLVTSRFHFTLPGIVAQNLDELPAEDAEALLRGIAPHVGEAAAEIADLCGYLPLALRLAGSALVEKKWLTPAEYSRRLADAKERLGLIDASLATSYELLTEEQRSRWRTLAVFPGTFDAAGAAAVWEMEIDPARDALGELITASLLEYECERHRLHDLARVFADSRLSSNEREKARRRHAGHYARVLRAADEFYLQGGASVVAGLTLFDTEWENVKVGQVWAALRAGENAEAAKLCSDYPDAGVYCLPLRLHPRERIAWLDSALVAARRGKDRLAEGNHLGNLGLAYAALGEPRRAIEHYEQALAIDREIGDRLGEGNALGALGLAYAALGEPQRAIEDYEQALVIDREIGDRRGEGDALGNLGLAYVDLGEPRRALEHYKQQLAIAREIGDRRGEANACWNSGLIYEQEGNFARAADFMQVLVDYQQSIGHPDAEMDAARVAALRARIR